MDPPVVQYNLMQVSETFMQPLDKAKVKDVPSYQSELFNVRLYIKFS